MTQSDKSHITKHQLDEVVETIETNSEKIINKGVANGYAGLDATGKVPAEQLPSFVDDVLEGRYVDETTFNDLDGHPYTPEHNKIYVDVDTNYQYRWSGTQYTRLADAADKVSKSTDNTDTIYGHLSTTTGTGKEVNIPVAKWPKADAIAWRDTDKTLSVGDPVNDDDAATKKYVDEHGGDGKVDRLVTEDSGAKSIIDNQKGQHGSVMQSDFDDTIASFNTADENGEDGIVAQIYAKTKSTNQGSRLNVKKDGIYYSKGTTATTEPGEEIATREFVLANSNVFVLKGTMIPGSVTTGSFDKTIAEIRAAHDEGKPFLAVVDVNGITENYKMYSYSDDGINMRINFSQIKPNNPDTIARKLAWFAPGAQFNITDHLVNEKFQLPEMPAANRYTVGDVVQYTGATTSEFTRDNFYRCVQVGGGYRWDKVSFTADLAFDESSIIKDENGKRATAMNAHYSSDRLNVVDNTRTIPGGTSSWKLESASIINPDDTTQPLHIKLYYNGVLKEHQTVEPPYDREITLDLSSSTTYTRIELKLDNITSSFVYGNFGKNDTQRIEVYSEQDSVPVPIDAAWIPYNKKNLQLNSNNKLETIIGGGIESIDHETVMIIDNTTEGKYYTSAQTGFPFPVWMFETLDNFVLGDKVSGKAYINGNPIDIAETEVVNEYWEVVERDIPTLTIPSIFGGTQTKIVATDGMLVLSCDGSAAESDDVKIGLTAERDVPNINKVKAKWLSTDDITIAGNNENELSVKVYDNEDNAIQVFSDGLYVEKSPNIDNVTILDNGTNTMHTAIGGGMETVEVTKELLETRSSAYDTTTWPGYPVWNLGATATTLNWGETVTGKLVLTTEGGDDYYVNVSTYLEEIQIGSQTVFGMIVEDMLYPDATFTHLILSGGNLYLHSDGSVSQNDTVGCSLGVIRHEQQRQYINNEYLSIDKTLNIANETRLGVTVSDDSNNLLEKTDNGLYAKGYTAGDNVTITNNRISANIPFTELSPTAGTGVSIEAFSSVQYGKLAFVNFYITIGENDISSNTVVVRDIPKTYKNDPIYFFAARRQWVEGKMEVTGQAILSATKFGTISNQTTLYANSSYLVNFTYAVA